MVHTVGMSQKGYMGVYTVGVPQEGYKGVYTVGVSQEGYKVAYTVGVPQEGYKGAYTVVAVWHYTYIWQLLYKRISVTCQLMNIHRILLAVYTKKQDY